MTRAPDLPIGIGLPAKGVRIISGVFPGMGLAGGARSHGGSAAPRVTPDHPASLWERPLAAKEAGRWL
jgi:hypothetical protein